MNNVRIVETNSPPINTIPSGACISFPDSPSCNAIESIPKINAMMDIIWGLSLVEATFNKSVKFRCHILAAIKRATKIQGWESVPMGLFYHKGDFLNI